MKRKHELGQALLIVLLSLAVVLTIVLYIVSRSVTDIAISTNEEDSLRAFSAAEAGIERALVIGESVSNSVGDAQFSASLTSFAKGAKQVLYPLSLSSGESGTFWFTGHNDDGSLGCIDDECYSGESFSFCWGNPDTSANEDTTPAVELTFIYTSTPGDYTTAKIARYLIDPNVTRRSQNNFSAPDVGTCTLGDSEHEFKKNINFSADLGISNSATENVLQFVRARMLYNTDNSHKMAIDVNFAGGGILPSQGVKVESEGSYSQSNRKVEVYQMHSEYPSIFENAIFSSSGITK